MDGRDLREADYGKFATGRSRMPQIPPRFSEAPHTTKMFLVLASSLVKVKELQSFPGRNLVVHPEADSSDLCMEDSGSDLAIATARFPNPTAYFPNATASTHVA